MSKLFLLSTEEYEKYKDMIPYACPSWWLRSQGTRHGDISAINYDGSVNLNGLCIDYANVCVRPAFKSKIYSSYLQKGDILNTKENVWIYLGDDIFISKYAVGCSKFDDESNNYNESYIKNVTLKNLETELFTKSELVLINDWKE